MVRELAPARLRSNRKPVGPISEIIETQSLGTASQSSGSKLPRHSYQYLQAFGGVGYHPRPEFTQKFTDSDVDTDST